MELGTLLREIEIPLLPAAAQAQYEQRRTTAKEYCTYLGHIRSRKKGVSINRLRHRWPRQ